MISGEPGLSILHVLRAPVGGLFRHVQDLAGEQAARGHRIGIVADSRTGGEQARQQFALLEPSLALGVTRLPMHREPHPTDLGAILRVHARIERLRPDIVHGHGSKGGLYARASGFLPGLARPLRVYTPHGGSLHDQPGRSLYLSVEKLVARKTDLLLFESDYIAARYDSGVGAGRALRHVVKNGLRPDEFSAVETDPDAADFVYVGELSAFKGVDTLIEALARLHGEGLPPRLAVVGSGCAFGKLSELVERHGLNRHVAFYGVLPAREAFALGRIVVAPSRAESLPYVALEAIAARKTLIATDVGGLNEIFGPLRDRLIPCDDPGALAEAMRAALVRGEAELEAERAVLADHVMRHFSVAVMADCALAAYREALARRDGRAPLPASPS